MMKSILMGSQNAPAIQNPNKHSLISPSNPFQRVVIGSKIRVSSCVC